MNCEKVRLEVAAIVIHNIAVFVWAGSRRKDGNEHYFLLFNFIKSQIPVPCGQEV